MSTLHFSSPMTVTLALSSEEQQKLQTRAAATGQQVDVYVSQLVRERIEKPQSFAEILAPIHKEVRESGMTEAELDALLEECREEVWQEKLAHQNNPA